MTVLPIRYTQRPARLLLAITIGFAAIGGWGVMQGNAAIAGLVVAILLLGTIIPHRTKDVALWGAILFRPRQYPAPPKQLPFGG